MDIKRKTCDIIDISSTNIDTLVPSLYKCVEIRSTEIFWLLSQPIQHLRFNLSVISERLARSRPSCEPIYAINTSTVNRKHSFMNILCIESFCPQTHTRKLLFGSTILNHGSHSDYWNHPMNMSMRVCYLDCHEAGLCCYLMIHIGTYYVHYSFLLQSVTYLLPLPRITLQHPVALCILRISHRPWATSSLPITRPLQVSTQLVIHHQVQKL
jgi:hypothetical protein